MESLKARGAPPGSTCIQILNREELYETFHGQGLFAEVRKGHRGERLKMSFAVEFLFDVWENNRKYQKTIDCE